MFTQKAGLSDKEKGRTVHYLCRISSNNRIKARKR
jgi:hypothetical protein